MKRFDCLQCLASLVDEHMLAVTSLSINAPFWFNVRPQGPNFFALNMGLCLPFALGLSVAFPKRKVIAIDSDADRARDLMRPFLASTSGGWGRGSATSTKSW